VSGATFSDWTAIERDLIAVGVAQGTGLAAVRTALTGFGPASLESALAGRCDPTTTGGWASGSRRARRAMPSC
jgi:hypothetical protein